MMNLSGLGLAARRQRRRSEGGRAAGIAGRWTAGPGARVRSAGGTGGARGRRDVCCAGGSRSPLVGRPESNGAEYRLAGPAMESK